MKRFLALEDTVTGMMLPAYIRHDTTTDAAPTEKRPPRLFIHRGHATMAKNKWEAVNGATLKIVEVELRYA